MPTITAARPRALEGSARRPLLAGGAVVTRENPIRGTEVLLIHRKRYNDWSLPKGKLEAGESLPACAVREVLEETGVTIRLGVPLDTIRYLAGKSGLKKVDYWCGSVLQTVNRAPDAEVDMVSWLPVRSAVSRLTYAHDHFLVSQYLQQPATTPLIILRHAKAMDRKDWSRKDSARPVNSRGRRQSRLLVPMLGAYGITRLITSTSARCQATLLPYAQDQKLSLDSFAQLSEEVGADDYKGVSRLVRKIRDQVLAKQQPTAIWTWRRRPWSPASSSSPT